MSSVPDTRNFMSELPGAIPAELRESMEKLFRAVDAGSVLETCEAALRHLGIHGELQWLPPEVDDQLPVPGRVSLAKDPQSLQTLVLVSDSAQLNETITAELTWLGR